MAVDPQVVVNIASEFTGKKAFKEAETATTKLSKGVNTINASPNAFREWPSGEGGNLRFSNPVLVSDELAYTISKSF